MVKLELIPQHSLLSCASANGSPEDKTVLVLSAGGSEFGAIVLTSPHPRNSSWIRACDTLNRLKDDPNDTLALLAVKGSLLTATPS